MKEIFYVILLFPSVAAAQKKNEHYQLNIRKAHSEVIVDGFMNEEAWKKADPISSFFMVLPMDTAFAKTRTEVRMTYDQQNIYLIATCYNNVTGPYFVESLRRDFVFNKNDNFSIYVDPFNNQTNGFSFGCNAAGAQRDGTLFEGGSNDLSWDNKWISVVKHDADKWIVEIAIPFKSIRYKKGIRTWGINFSRLDLRSTEKSSWAPVPRQFPTASLAYTGMLIWDEPPPDQSANLSVIPYALTGLSKNYEQRSPVEFNRKIGSDLKFGLSSSLNLDLTINPDFSQVEVDQQVTNLNRFELFFPERRQFFLENADLFANFGYANIRPFFSRRIGLNVPIVAGARLSGSLDKNWRIGLMDMQTGQAEERQIPGQNFGVLSLQRRVFKRSNINLLVVNKQSANSIQVRDTATPLPQHYNRNIGIEYNHASQDNLWTGKMLLLKSFSPGYKGDDIVQAGHIRYHSRLWNILIQEEVVPKNYLAEVGYTPRNGYIKFTGEANRLFFPRKGKMLSYGPQISSSRYFDQKLHRTDHSSSVGVIFNFRNASTFKVAFSDEYLELLKPFDPTNTGKDTLARGTVHQWQTFQTEVISKPQSLLTYYLNGSYGGYYLNSTRLNLAGSIGYRFQPYVSLSANVSYNKIDLPSPWNRSVFWLVGSQVDVTFTNKLFFNTFLQYNGQQNNININLRLQWRYKPASDLFIVYTDNYLPAPFSAKSKALVLKLTYWWNR